MIEQIIFSGHFLLIKRVDKIKSLGSVWNHISVKVQ